MKHQLNRNDLSARAIRIQTGFTLVELLVVIAIIAILAAMLLSALATTKSKAQAIQCLSNHKQLASAWLMYASDNGERLPFSVGPDGWYPGMQDFLGSNPSNWDINQDMAKSKLWSYVGKAPGVFQCPAEQSYVVSTYGPNKGQRVRRLRSMTMSVWMGGIQGGFDFGPGLNDQAWRAFHKTTDMTSPGPTGLIVFTDQREDENGWPNLFIDMTGYPKSPAQTQFTDDLVALYVFTATLPSGWGTNADGAYPEASLIVSAGTLYGVASAGGRFGNGTVFAMATDGTGFTNLHDFIGGPDGAGPLGGLILSGSTLYGTTLGGAAGQGTVFALQVDGTQFSTLYGFPLGGSTAALILSGDTLYGTTYTDGDSGYGSVFSVKTNGSGFKTLHSFTEWSGPLYTNTDGADPMSKLVLSGTTLYGTAHDGGPFGSGVVFALNIDSTSFTNLHIFSGGSDGASPSGPLILSNNTLYGTGSTIFSISFAPQLTMNSSGSNVILSWPTNYAGFDYSGYHLQSATDLNSPVWTTNLPAPDVINGRYTVTNPVSGTQQFFRLSQ